MRCRIKIDVCGGRRASHADQNDSRRWMRAARVCGTGGSLIEVSLTLPIFLMLLIGSTVFGVLCYDGIEVSSAARSGAQYGMQNHATASDNTGMQTVALKNGTNVPGMTAVAKSFCQCASNLGDSSKNVTCTSICSGVQTTPIEFVQVNTSATVSPMLKTPLPWVWPTSYTLTGQAIMRVQQ